MGDDVTSWMDCLYYYLVGGATLPIFLCAGCAASVHGGVDSLFVGACLFDF